MIIKAVEADSRQVRISSAYLMKHIIPLLTLYTIILIKESAFLDDDIDIQMSYNKCYTL